ncbi:MAG: hypothetical protein WAU08_02565 [Flavobacteriales bacterium]
MPDNEKPLKIKGTFDEVLKVSFPKKVQPKKVVPKKKISPKK